MGHIYLITALPKLTVDTPVEITRQELDFLLEQNLSRHELTLIYDIRHTLDIFNTIRWFRNLPLSYHGNILPYDLKTALEQEDSAVLPSDIIAYLNNYPEISQRSEHANSLLFTYFHNLFFKQTTQHSSNILRKGWRAKRIVLALHKIEHLIRLIFAYLRELEKEPISDSPSPKAIYDEEVQHIFGFSLTSAQDWPENYQELYYIWQQYQHSPQDLMKAITSWKFSYFENLIPPLSHFGLEHILIYCAQFDLLERRNRIEHIPIASFIEKISKAR